MGFQEQFLVLESDPMILRHRTEEGSFCYSRMGMTHSCHMTADTDAYGNIAVRSVTGEIALSEERRFFESWLPTYLLAEPINFCGVRCLGFGAMLFDMPNTIQWSYIP